MSPTLIITDLDGTLLRTDKTISEYTKNVLQQCRASGIKIAYATGRANPHLVINDKLFNAQISCNGAVVRVNGNIIHSKLIHADVARPLLAACVKRSMNIVSEYNGKHYENSVTYNTPAEKIYTWTQSSQDIEFLEQNLPDDTHMLVARDGMAMIMHREATKAKAVAALAAFWDIAQANIMAFGDDLNDIDILKYAGTGVAMENALGEVKDAADYIYADQMTTTASQIL